MFSLSYEEIIQDEKTINKKDVCLVAYLSQNRFIKIIKAPLEIRATDSRGVLVASSLEVSESGLRKVKRRCRGWFGYEKLIWKIELE